MGGGEVIVVIVNIWYGLACGVLQALNAIHKSSKSSRCCLLEGDAPGAGSTALRLLIVLNRDAVVEFWHLLEAAELGLKGGDVKFLVGDEDDFVVGDEERLGRCWPGKLRQNPKLFKQPQLFSRG